METIRVESWEQFEEELRKRTASVPGGLAGYLFRGQESEAWPLTTTLERAPRQISAAREYYHIIASIMPEVETFTGKQWELPRSDEIEQFCQDWHKFKDELYTGGLPGYEYMIYLRHHGFPSPLLDWSRSPYVAAYFAFSKARKDNVSVFVFVEQPFDEKGTSSSESSIFRLGRQVVSHRRHFLQQASYTVCAKFSGPLNDGSWHFAKHEEVFARGETEQDLLWKFTIPFGERTKVLRRLDSYNLNGFSLFGSEESLLETMAFREMAIGPDESATADGSGEGTIS